MNSSAITIEPEPPSVPLAAVSASVDRVRLIRRSVRCLLLGLFGMVPIIGSPLALLALRLHTRVMAETGEIWRPARLHAALTVGLALMIGADVITRFAVALLVFAVILGLLAFRLARQYQTGAPAKWNPARRQLYWGVGFAYAGLLGTLLCVAAGLNRLISTIIE